MRIPKSSGARSKAEKRLFCDLVVLPANLRGTGLFVELKVWSDFQPSQLLDYRVAAKRMMPSLEPHIVTVTPFLDRPPDSDYHITWSDIFEDLKLIGESDNGVVFSEFAGFLKLRGMSKPVKVDKLDAVVVKQLRAAAGRIQQFNELFWLLASDKRLKGIFAERDLDRPKFEYDDVGRARLCVFNNTVPWYYAGIWALPSGDAVMLVELALEGDKLASVKRLRPSLQKEFEQAKVYAKAEDNWANVGRVVKKGRWTETLFVFAQRMGDNYNGHPQKIREWFTSVLLEARRFAGLGINKS
jgi:hypothetical protein